MWPLARTDDVLSAFYVADEGRADPVGVATSLAKGARQLGVAIVEGVAATGVRDPRAAGDRRAHQTAGRIETEVVVNAAGMWARQFGALAGVAGPAAGRRALLPADRHGAGDGPGPAGHRGPGPLRLLPARGRRHAGRPVRAGGRRRGRWTGVPGGFSFGKLPPDWERMEPFLGRRMDRIPVLADTGVRTFFCGPESFTSDVHPLLGPAPELDGYFVAAGLNSLGILSGGGVGRACSRTGSWTACRRSTSTGVRASTGRAAYETSRRFRAERTVEQLGVLFGDAVWPAWKPSDRAQRPPLGAARPAGRGGRALRRLGRLGVRRSGSSPGPASRPPPRLDYRPASPRSA